MAHQNVVRAIQILNADPRFARRSLAYRIGFLFSVVLTTIEKTALATYPSGSPLNAISRKEGKPKLYALLIELPVKVDVTTGAETYPDVDALMTHFMTERQFRSVAKLFEPRKHFVTLLTGSQTVPKVKKITDSNVHQVSDADEYWRQILSLSGSAPAPAPAQKNCAQCTFANDPNLQNCEMCGNSLPMTASRPTPSKPRPSRPTPSKPRPSRPSQSGFRIGTGRPKPYGGAGRGTSDLDIGAIMAQFSAMEDSTEVRPGKKTGKPKFRDDISVVDNEAILPGDATSSVAKLMLRITTTRPNAAGETGCALIPPLPPVDLTLTGPSMFRGTIADSVTSIMDVYLQNPALTCRRLFDLSTQSEAAMTQDVPNQLYTPPINSNNACFVNTTFWNLASPSFIPILASVFNAQPLINIDNRAAAFQLLDGITRLVRSDNVQDPFDVYRGNYAGPDSRDGKYGDAIEQQDTMVQRANPLPQTIRGAIGLANVSVLYTTNSDFGLQAQHITDNAGAAAAGAGGVAVAPAFSHYAAATAMLETSLGFETAEVAGTPNNLGARRGAMYNSMVTSPFILQPMCLVNLRIVTSDGLDVLDNIQTLPRETMGYRTLKVETVDSFPVPERSDLTNWTRDIIAAIDQAAADELDVASSAGASAGAPSGLPPPPSAALPPRAAVVPPAPPGAAPPLVIREMSVQLNPARGIFRNSFLKGTLSHQEILGTITPIIRAHGTFMREIVSTAIDGFLDVPNGVSIGVTRRAALPRISKAAKYLTSAKNTLEPIYGAAWADMLKPYSSQFSTGNARAGSIPGPYETAIARRGFTNTSMMSAAMAQLASPVVCNIGAREGPSHGNDLAFGRVPHAALNLVKLTYDGDTVNETVQTAARYWRFKLEYWKANKILPADWNGVAAPGKPNPSDVTRFEIHPDAEELLMKATGVVNSIDGMIRAFPRAKDELKSGSLREGLLTITTEHAFAEARASETPERDIRAPVLTGGKLDFHVASLSGEAAMLMQTSISLQWLSLRNALGCRVGPNGSAAMVARFGLGASCGFKFFPAGHFAGLDKPLMVSACTLRAPAGTKPYKMYLWTDRTEFTPALLASLADPDKLWEMWLALYGADTDSPIITHAYSCTVVGDDDARAYESPDHKAIVQSQVELVNAPETDEFLAKAFCWSRDQHWVAPTSDVHLPIQPRRAEVPDDVDVVVLQPEGNLDMPAAATPRSVTSGAVIPIRLLDASAGAKMGKVKLVQMSHAVPADTTRVYKPYQHQTHSFVMFETATGTPNRFELLEKYPKIPKYPAVYGDDVRGIRAIPYIPTGTNVFNGVMVTSDMPPTPHDISAEAATATSFNQNTGMRRTHPMAPVHVDNEARVPGSAPRVIAYPVTNWAGSAPPVPPAAPTLPADFRREVNWYKNMIGQVLPIWISDSTYGSIPTLDRLGGTAYTALLDAAPGSDAYTWITQTLFKDIAGTILALAGFPIIYDRFGNPCVTSLMRNAAYAAMFNGFLPQGVDDSDLTRSYLGNILSELKKFMDDFRARNTRGAEMVAPYYPALSSLVVPAGWKTRIQQQGGENQMNLGFIKYMKQYPLSNEYAFNAVAGNGVFKDDVISFEPNRVIELNPGIFMRPVRIAYSTAFRGTLGHWYAYKRFGERWFRIDTLDTPRMIPVPLSEVKKVLENTYGPKGGLVYYEFCDPIGATTMSTWADRLKFIRSQMHAILSYITSCTATGIKVDGSVTDNAGYYQALYDGSAMAGIADMPAPADSQDWAYSAMRVTRPMMMVKSKDPGGTGTSPYLRLVNAIRVFRWLISGTSPLGALGNEPCEVYKAFALHMTYGVSLGVVVETILGSRLRQLHARYTFDHRDPAVVASQLSIMLDIIPDSDRHPQPAYGLLELKRDLADKGATLLKLFGLDGWTALASHTRAQAIASNRAQVLELMDRLAALDVNDADASRAFIAASGMNATGPASPWWNAFHVSSPNMPPVLVGRLFNAWEFPAELVGVADDVLVRGNFIVTSVDSDDSRTRFAQQLRYFQGRDGAPDFGQPILAGITSGMIPAPGVEDSVSMDALVNYLFAQEGGPEYVARLGNHILELYGAASPTLVMPVLMTTKEGAAAAAAAAAAAPEVIVLDDDDDDDL